MKTLIAFSIICLLIPSMASATTDFYITQGITMPGGAGNISDYYRAGYEASLGIKLPFSFWSGWEQNWIDLGYGYLPFDRGEDFPISYPYATIPTMTGKGTNIFSMAMNLQIISSKPRKFHDYFLFGIGYMKRSKLIINTNSTEFPHFETKFGGGGFFSLGFGLNYRLSNRFIIFTDIQYATANTAPSKTGFAPWRIGLIFHNSEKGK
jgi:hypothetical protein